jgi:hypothetical protein
MTQHDTEMRTSLSVEYYVHHGSFAIAPIRMIPITARR